ncbi:MAG: succinate dehydrogenase/fumarate reductase iron-sulfur subunit [Proteobacteria bacterium]|nr:succinate dehydrogenase/fumarate reductase iron-sulfur subunit [Pseudomonadota bacterium]
MAERRFRIWRGNDQGGDFEAFDEEVSEGMVVLDVLHVIQARQAPDLAVRWNCKAGKCGSCSMEINGKPRLACMTRMNIFEADETITVQPLKTFPVVKDLVSDVSWNYQQNQRIAPFKVKAPGPDGKHRMYQEDVDRVQEFRKCIECFLCQNVCHILRDRDGKDRFVGPRFMIRAAGLEMNPLDDRDRVPEVRAEYGSGMCNITRCCTEVCPEGINITDNGIIPMKERVVDRYYDPLRLVGRKLFGIRKRKEPESYTVPAQPQPRSQNTTKGSNTAKSKQDE